MIKKLLFWSALAVGGLVLVNAVKPGAIATWGKRVHVKFVEKSFSPEFELARIKDQIKELTPDMHKNLSRIAEEMVQVDALQVRVNDMQVRLNEQREVITAMTDSLERGQPVIVGGKKISPAQIKDKLRKYKDAEKSYDVAKKTLDARKEALETARQQLYEIRNQKEALQLQATEFETELAALKLAQIKTKFAL